jgi:hypothetical protein
MVGSSLSCFASISADIIQHFGVHGAGANQAVLEMKKFKKNGGDR